MADFTPHEIRLSEAKKYINHAAVRRHRPVMLWGAPGVGKSDIVASIVKDAEKQGLNAKLFDMRLSMCEPTDLMGIPFYNAQSNTMEWAPPALLPSKEDGEKNDLLILFLDELNGAAPAVQAAAYQLILNRRVGNYVLPDNCAVVAAGNRESDKGVTYRMPKPLANRFIHFNVKVHFDDWLEWATGNDVHPDVVGYLNANKGHLFKFDPKSPENAFPTPRSWVFVSDIIKDSDGFSEAEISDMVIGTIGEGMAVNFMAHRKVSGMLPDPFLILQGKVNDLKTKEISALYALATSMAYELNYRKTEVGQTIDQDEFNSYVNNALKFWLKHFDPEMTIMAFRTVLKFGLNIDISKIEAWKEFYERFGDLVRKA